MIFFSISPEALIYGNLLIPLLKTYMKGKKSPIVRLSQTNEEITALNILFDEK